MTPAGKEGRPPQIKARREAFTTPHRGSLIHLPMAESSPLPFALRWPAKTEEEEETERAIYRRWRDHYSTLAVGKGWSLPLYRNGKELWYGTMASMVGATVAQEHFVARQSDVILATFPKSGSTWIKALVFAAVNRRAAGGLRSPGSPLSTLSPHECVPFLEYQVYSNDRIPDLSSMPSPRLFATHVPFDSLPRSVADSGCRIIYLWRDPKAVFVSLWHFHNRNRASWSIDGGTLLSLEEAFEMFCDGLCSYGPSWDHVLGYWKAAAESGDSNQVLFLRYEDLVEDTGAQLKRIAEFIGAKFTEEEEDKGVVDDIVDLCSFKNLKNSSEATKAGGVKIGDKVYERTAYFRKGETRDWINYLTADMSKRLDQITADKFSGSGLPF